MANINMQSIMGKVHTYEKTAECQQRMRDYILQCMYDGRRMLHSGVLLFTFNEMEESVTDFMYELKRSVKSYGLPGSMADILDGMDYSDIVNDKSFHIDGYDIYKTSISFNVSDSDLHRNSLYHDKYPEGIDNIIALLNNGYTAKNFVWGEWHGRQIRSLPSRDGTHFIQRTSEDYREKWHSFYGDNNAFLVINIDYQYDINDGSESDGSGY